MNIFFSNNSIKEEFKKGFTLIESLIAISILVVSVTALMGVVSQSIFTSGYIKNKAVALSLAQEGVELVRNIQDTALLAESFETFELLNGEVFSQCVYGTGVCTIDPTSLAMVSCPNQNCPPLKISENGYFNYFFGQDSAFTRFISILPTGVESGKVTVIVEWMQGNTVRNVTYEADMFLWIQ